MTVQDRPQMRSTSGMTLDDSVFTRLLGSRIIFLGSEVSDDVANRIAAQLLLLAADDPHADIDFYINSPGGSVTAGMVIYDTMQLISPDVSTWGMGFVASMGQFLLSSGAPGKRFCLPNTRVLMHQPSAGIGGVAADVSIQVAAFVDTKERMARITAEQTGQSYERIVADSDRDRWFTSEQAQEYGFVDQVARRVPQPVA